MMSLLPFRRIVCTDRAPSAVKLARTLHPCGQVLEDGGAKGPRGTDVEYLIDDIEQVRSLDCVCVCVAM